jgi:hypothetical protein
MGINLYLELLQEIEEKDREIERKSQLIKELLERQLHECNYCLLQEVKDGHKSTKRDDGLR